MVRMPAPKFDLGRLALILDLVVTRDSLRVRRWGCSLAGTGFRLMRRSRSVGPVTHVRLPWWGLLGLGLAATTGTRCAPLLIVAYNDVGHATTAFGLIDPLVVVITWLREFGDDVPCVEKTGDLYELDG